MLFIASALAALVSATVAPAPGWYVGGELARPPYVGLACVAPCTRVGIAVWLRRPATGVGARLAGKSTRLHAGGLGGRAPLYWQGFVRLSSLRVPRGWTGVHPVITLKLRLAIRYRHNLALKTLRVRLHPGCG